MAFTNDTGGVPRATMGRAPIHQPKGFQDYLSEANCGQDKIFRSSLESALDELSAQVVALGDTALSLQKRLGPVLRSAGPECGNPEQCKTELAEALLIGQLNDKASDLASTRLLLQSLLDRLVL